jgi:flagellar basal-body rod modification protein FlgD
MANETSALGALGSSATNASAAPAPSATKKKNEEIGKNEFLQLLVTQLKNQDPLDPMKSEEFAVNLAQFSQLEQLVSINEKIGTESQDLSSLAGYLGNQVVLDAETVNVENGDGGQLKLDLAQASSALSVELKDSSGIVQGSKVFENLPAGKQTLTLDGLGVANGEYSFSLSATSVNGATLTPSAQVAGIVTGFVPGPDPVLMVGGRQVKPSEVREVSMVK